MPIIGELYTMTINYGFMSNTTTYLLEKAVKSCEVLVSVVSQPNESDDRKQTPGPKAVFNGWPVHHVTIAYNFGYGSIAITLSLTQIIRPPFATNISQD